MTFVYTCPNPKCGTHIPDLENQPDRIQNCTRCGCHLFPTRPHNEREETRTRPPTERREHRRQLDRNNQQRHRDRAA